MAHDPVHLFMGLYDSAEAAERDFHNVVSLHRQGLVGAYDAALLERDEDGALRVAHKKRSGHHILAGFGVGALLTVLTPFVAIPFGLIGAGTGALVRHAEGSLPGRTPTSSAPHSKRRPAPWSWSATRPTWTGSSRCCPEAPRRVAKVLDIDKDEFAEALRQAAEEG